MKVKCFTDALKIMAVAAVLVAVSSSCFAADYFVSTTGNDSNAGTSSGASFRTIQRCLNAVKPGDTCWIAGGTYSESLTLITTGTNSARITIRNYNNGQVVIDSGKLRAISLRGNIGYYTIDGLSFVSTYAGKYVGDFDYSLDFASSTWWGWNDPSNGNNGFIIQNCNIRGSIAFMGSRNIVQNCVIDGGSAFSNGIKELTASSHHNIYRDNVIAHFTERGVWSMTATDSVTVSGNRIYDFGKAINGAGIDLDGAYIACTNGVLKNNVIYNGNYGLQFENGFNCIADGNTVYDCKRALSGINYGTAIGSIKEYRTSDTGNVFMNNIVYNSSEAGLIIISSPGCLILNNTIHNTANYFAGIILATEGSSFACNNTIIKNNIVSDSTIALYLQGNVTGLDISNNMYYNANGTTNTHYWDIKGRYTLAQFQSVSGLDASSKYTDPLYSDVIAKDFRIKSSSPAKDNGVVMPSVPADIIGTVRPQGLAPDMGAYEMNQAKPVMQLSPPSLLSLQ